MPLKPYIERLLREENFDSPSCKQLFEAMLQPNANRLQTAALLVLLRAKPETAEELSSFATLLQQKMLPLQSKHKLLDLVGTGGDGANTVNISTGSAILAASCGVKIAKHGSRNVSSLTGSADVLEAIGIAIDLTPEKISACIDEIGIGFCFAPNFHPMLQQLKSLRQELRVPTSFNLLGPLLNPAKPSHVIFGVFDGSLLPTIAKTMQQLGTERSLIVHGCGLDELSCLGTAEMLEVTAHQITSTTIDPTKFGLEPCQLTALQGGDAAYNASRLWAALSNKDPSFANTMILNAGVALYLYGIHRSIVDGIQHARDHLQRGLGLNLLKQWIEYSND